MLYPVSGSYPVAAPSARAANSADLIGEVKLRHNANIWYHAVVRADNEQIVIGENSNIQDNCTLHADCGQPCVIKQGVTVGHNAVLHSCTVENNCVIGMGAIILNGAVIGENSVVGAASLVTKNTVIPPDSLVLGSPAKVVRTLSEEEIAANRRSALQYVLHAEQQLPLLQTHKKHPAF